MSVSNNKKKNSSRIIALDLSKMADKWQNHKTKLKASENFNNISAFLLLRTNSKRKDDDVRLLFFKVTFLGAPGWLSRLSIWLLLRSWSHGLWVWDPHRALCWQLRAWSLFQTLRLPLSLSLPAPLPHLCVHEHTLSLSLSHSLSKVNK